MQFVLDGWVGGFTFSGSAVQILGCCAPLERVHSIIGHRAFTGQKRGDTSTPCDARTLFDLPQNTHKLTHTHTHTHTHIHKSL